MEASISYNTDLSPADSEATSASLLDDLLLQTTQSKPIIGSKHKVYNFPLSAKGFENYVLRIPKSIDIKAALAASTCLCPVKHVIADMHIGQALMQLDGAPEVQILAKQPGISLDKQRQIHEKHFYNNYAYASHLGDLRPHWRERWSRQLSARNFLLFDIEYATGYPKGPNPFLEIFDQAYQLAYTYPTLLPDLHIKNIFLDKKEQTLHLIDMFDAQEPKTSLSAADRFLCSVENLKRSLYYPSIDIPGHERLASKNYRESQDKVAALIDVAAEEILARHAQHNSIDEQVRFAQINDVKVARSDSPDLLIKALKGIAKAANIPGFTR